MELLDYYCFNNLTQSEKEELINTSKKVMLPSEYILYYVGDICNDVLFLKSGKVKIYIQPNELGSEEMTLYELEAGSQCVVNLFSTITSSQTIANAKTITPIEGWLVPQKTIKWLINHSESFRDFKIDIVGKRMNALVSLLTDVKFSNIEQLLLNWLYVQGLSIIKITHEKIASTIGVTRETVSRNLKKLEQKGYIKLHRGMIAIN
ncbi:MAG: Crp/Fnr family transcriptional regulator [Arcobacteraceae bacterium]|jgi:CRP/FNR family transcriptional regulator|nr:Crp/Fnr family transcriptional regulator [Arcobacteraceae bacterium]